MVTTTQARPQNYIVSGVKFFKETLDKLRLDAERTDQTLSCSELVVFMILHTYVNETGEIHSLTRDPDVSDRRLLAISHIAKEHELVYETTKKAMDRLIERQYIAEVYSGNKFHYEIVDYSKYNNTEELNYFRIPKQMFDEKVFGQLIAQRYHKAPLLLLELSQYFTRQLGTNKRYADFETLKGIRTMSYLKGSLQTTAERVRRFLNIITNIFKFKAIDPVIKKPVSDRLNRLREFTQVCIDKFEFTLNQACLLKNDKQKEKSTIALSKREVANRFKNANIRFKWRDMLDINKSVSRMSRLSLHLECVNKNKNMLRYILINACDVIETLNHQGELNNIKSIGAFFNKLVTNAWVDYRKSSISDGDRIEIITAYHRKYDEKPEFLS